MKDEEGRFIRGVGDQVSGVRSDVDSIPESGDERAKGECRKLKSKNLRSSGSICGFDSRATVPARSPAPHPGKSSQFQSNPGISR